MKESRKTGSILTAKTEQNIFEKLLLSPLLAGESITGIWVPHAGRRKALVYLTQNSKKFKFGKLGKYKILFIDKDELAEETPNAYFQLILRQIGKDALRKKTPDEPFFILRDELKKLLEKDYHIILILRRFDDLRLPAYFYDNLYNIWSLNRTRFHFVFAITKDIFQKDIFAGYGQLRHVLSQNIIYFPLFEEKDREVAAKLLAQKYGYKISSDNMETAKKLSGGHPALLKACMRVLEKSPKMSKENTLDFLFNQWEIKLILEDIWECLTEEEKNAVLSQNAIPLRLMGLRIMTKDTNKKYQLFSPLFEMLAGTKQTGTKGLSLDKETGEVLVGGRPAKEKITLKEYHLLSLFLGKPKITLSRDEIASALWGKESYDKYSDWAIDQVISQLRRKLIQLGVSSKNLQTIRGRGYRWVD